MQVVKRPLQRLCRLHGLLPLRLDVFLVHVSRWLSVRMVALGARDAVLVLSPLGAGTIRAPAVVRFIVQRRRPDIQDGWGEDKAFKPHLTKSVPYELVGDYQALQEDVLDYCLEVTNRP